MRSCWPWRHVARRLKRRGGCSRACAAQSGRGARAASAGCDRAFGLQPHRSETFKLSSDPDFVGKVRDIARQMRCTVEVDTPLALAMPRELQWVAPSGVGLYMAPPDRALVLCVDEKSQIQAPTGASWINQVERFFALLSERQIKRGAHRSVAALQDAITSFITANNAHPKPFRWTKTADDILASIERFCLRISPA